MKKLISSISLMSMGLTIVLTSCENHDPAPILPIEPTEKFHESIWKEIAVLNGDGEWDSLEEDAGDTLLFRTDDLNQTDTLLFSEGVYSYTNPKLGALVNNEGLFEVNDTEISFIHANTDTSSIVADFAFELIKSETDTTLEISNVDADSLISVKYKNIGFTRADAE